MTPHQPLHSSSTARRLLTLIALVAVLATTAVVVPPSAAAQDNLCFGRRATIVVRAPGQTTVGTAGNDVIVGTAGPDTIRGGGGNDLICGRGGRDRLFGDSGNDQLRGDKGRDRLAGGRGHDRCVPNARRGRLSGCNSVSAPHAGCILYLHGAGTPPGSRVERWDGGLLYLAPHSPNPEAPWFWLYDGPHNTRYDPGAGQKAFRRLVRYLTRTLNRYGCGPVMIHGASNGGGFAARIYCSGESFNGRLWGVFVDDPVPDAGVIGCSPSRSVKRSLFVHSTEVVTEAARFRNNRCSRSPTLQWPWYCQDDIGFDLREYEAHIGQRSVWGRHDHVAQNRAEVNFWTQVRSWWHQYDPRHY